MFAVNKLFDILEKQSEWMSYYLSVGNSIQLSASVGQDAENMCANRYCNVWPWDHNRVVLRRSPDYINASHIKSPIVNHQYIATQEPLSGMYANRSTKDDFWRMIWEQNCSVIVMLNDPSENNSYQNARYYPYYPTGLHKYTQYSGEEEIKVSLLSREEKNVYIHSKLELKLADSPSREIHHLQFKGWGDYEVPDSADEFYTFLREARALFAQHPGPPVVHCSAGVGRTGTFLLADAILEIAKERKSLIIDVRAVLTCLRRQRMWLVQTPEQLRFSIMVVLEGLKHLVCSDFTDETVSID